MSILKRPRTDERIKSRPSKKARQAEKKKHYNSSSSEEDNGESPDFHAVNLQDSEDDKPAEAKKPAKRVPKVQFEAAPSEASASEGEEGEEDDGAESDITGASSGSDSEGSTSSKSRKTRKRNDPTAFATSISKILSSKLTTSKRSDPVLSRSKDAEKAGKELAEARLDAKARNKLRAEKREAMDRGRVRDVLGLETPETSTAAIMEQERKLKKTAQRGVVKLFNAVRAAQVKGEIAARQVQKQGVVGIDKREEKVSEMSKQGFLELIASGGKSTATTKA
ncbi:Rrp15p-domain-containing protein [Trichodelitschia bisporula]|uniref:Rrp15p-domain-containing protein n=1 Tax=Trichodelitschia bisporula TaxID=703511 RepID=A0A6G1I3V8_9PEZI|nr:Rrp15p-domain-containing protein [Trichodelitschia bisporula]